MDSRPDDPLASLPELAFIDNRTDKSPGAPPVIVVKRGETGRWPVYTRLTAAELNQGMCTPAQAAAMHAGSMFGWSTPAANPSLYDEEGHIDRAALRRLSKTSSSATSRESST